MRIANVIFNYLVYHAGELQKNKIAIARQYSREYEPHLKMLTFLDAYIQGIEDRLDSCERVQGQEDAPFVILNSTIEVENIQDGECARLCVTLPVEGFLTPYEQFKDAKVVSCFSHAGRALLFKEQGQPFALDEGGEKNCMIRSIEYPLNL
jgi:transcription elongation GreA/GreB family factor